MGAWGTGIFDNDATLDWLGDLESETDVQLVHAALAEVAGAPPDEYLDADLGSQALAAAALVVSALVGPLPDLPESALTWLDAAGDQVGPELATLALSSLARLTTNSELEDLWAEGGRDSDEYREWSATLTGLRGQLSAAANSR